MDRTESLLKLAIAAALLAGKEIMRIYETGDFAVEMKSDNSPLTKADFLSHRLIAQQLSSSQLPLLSEEGKHISFEERREWDTYWLVDPLDGTREFIKQNGEFTVNIALMKRGTPIAGVVYAPCLKTLYYGAKGSGAYRIKNDFPAVSLTEGNTLFADLLQRDSVTIVASRSHSNSDTVTFINRFKNYELQTMGSSLKFMLLAEGVADIYPRLAPTMEWDTAAAHAVLNALNRKVYQMNLTHELAYNKVQLVNPSFIAF